MVNTVFFYTQNKISKFKLGDEEMRGLIIALLILLSGCSNSATSDKLNVYTGFYAIYDFTKLIGNDKIQITNMIPNGVEPHDWEPSTKDMINLQKADVLFYNGGGLEHWVDKISNIKCVNLTDGLKLKNDPHVWLDPTLAKHELSVIKNNLCELDASNKTYYEDNYAKCVAKLDELDKNFADMTKSLKHNKIVVAHAAYGYLCERYGLEQIAIEGIEDNAEPSAEQMKHVIDYINQNDIRYVFYETQPSKAIRIVAEQTETKLLELNPFELSVNGDEDYFDVMEHNLENLKKANE